MFHDVFCMLNCSWKLFGGSNGAQKTYQIPPSGHESSVSAPSGKPSQIIMFQACPQATKSHPNWSQSHRKPCENDTNIDIIPTYVKSWFLQYLPHQMLDSRAPDIQIQTPKSLKNVTCKHACQKIHLLCQSWPKTSKWRPRNPSKIDRNLSCQKTESTIVLAMLQSTGKSQVVFSHKRGTESAF